MTKFTHEHSFSCPATMKVVPVSSTSQKCISRSQAYFKSIVGAI